MDVKSHNGSTLTVTSLTYLDTVLTPVEEGPRLHAVEDLIRRVVRNSVMVSDIGRDVMKELKDKGYVVMGITEKERASFK